MDRILMRAGLSLRGEHAEPLDCEAFLAAGKSGLPFHRDMAQKRIDIVVSGCNC